MAKRGRKKGGLKINPLNDRNEIIKMIINQTNSLNKKIKNFAEKGYDEYHSFYTQTISDLVQYTDKGLSKSKRQYDEASTLMLKKTLSALHKVNNSDIYGTVKKFEKKVEKATKYMVDYAKDYYRKKGYSDDFINNTVDTIEFKQKLKMALTNEASRYESNQTIDKVALDYGEDVGLSNQQIDKELSNIEYSRNQLDRLQQKAKEMADYEREKEEFREWQRNKRKR